MMICGCGKCPCSDFQWHMQFQSPVRAPAKVMLLCPRPQSRCSSLGKFCLGQIVYFFGLKDIETKYRSLLKPPKYSDLLDYVIRTSHDQ